MDRLILRTRQSFRDLSAWRSARSARMRSRRAPDADLLATFEVGVRYQMYHAFALLAVGWAQTRWPGGAERKRVGCSSPAR